MNSTFDHTPWHGLDLIMKQLSVHMDACHHHLSLLTIITIKWSKWESCCCCLNIKKRSAHIPAMDLCHIRPSPTFKQVASHSHGSYIKPFLMRSINLRANRGVAQPNTVGIIKSAHQQFSCGAGVSGCGWKAKTQDQDENMYERMSDCRQQVKETYLVPWIGLIETFGLIAISGQKDQ